ncbi:MAG: TRAP transporter small permease [Planctomycetes bacterium]|nr:TRAP transporter small permease [Planctomycetota bacterium]
MIERSKSRLARLEAAISLTLMAVLLSFCLVPVVARLLGTPGLPWAQPFTEYLVLWIALFGAAAATRQRKHIAIDAIGHYLPDRPRLALRGVGELVACAVLIVLIPPAIAFVRDERAFSGDDAIWWGVPTWWLPLVIPFGLGWIGLRLLLAGAVDIGRSIRPPKASIASGDAE